MPKSFSEQQRASITESLLRVGLKRFSRQGIRAVRVDDLCREVGIAKGSFYAFFPSKEALFLVVARQISRQHRIKIEEFLRTNSLSASSRAGGFFDLLVEMICADPLLQLIVEHGEIEYLMRLIPARTMVEMEKENQLFLEEIAEAFSDKNSGCAPDPKKVEALFALTKCLLMQRQFIPASTMKNSAELLRMTFIDQLAGKTEQGTV